MPNLPHITGFALLALALALTPGPNMAYLVSRSICQGRRAGMASLAGVAIGFVFYVLCAAFAITALLLAVPDAYDALRFGGAAYLLFLAWLAAQRWVMGTVLAGWPCALPRTGGSRGRFAYHRVLVHRWHGKDASCRC